MLGMYQKTLTHKLVSGHLTLGTCSRNLDT
jgi:hypothetical protein